VIQLKYEGVEHYLVEDAQDLLGKMVPWAQPDLAVKQDLALIQDLVGKQVQSVLLGQQVQAVLLGQLGQAVLLGQLGQAVLLGQLGQAVLLGQLGQAVLLGQQA
jgi:hypothetical protein